MSSSKYFPRTALSRFRRKEDGGIALFAGLTLPIVVGFAGLGLETAIWYQADARSQTAADIAAHAAGKELELEGENQELADQVAINAAMQLGFQPSDVTTTVESTASGIKVEVAVTSTQKRYFSSLFNSNDVKLSANSTVLVEAAGEACLLALDPNGDGVVFGGNTAVNLNKCLVMSNADKSASFSLTGSATLTAACAVAVGDVNVQKAHAVNFETCSEARAFAKPTLDPYAGLAMPDLTSGDYVSCASLPGGSKGKGKGKKSSSSGSDKIETGRYCGGLTFSGNMEIEDGATLVIDGGTFKNQGPASITGEDVTIIFMNDATMKLTSQAEMDLKAKTSGIYAGLIFAGDAKTQSTSHRFNGGSGTRLQGAFYLPSDSLELRGGANVTTGCLHMIAKDIDARGSSRFANSCANAGTKPLVVSGGVRMTE